MWFEFSQSHDFELIMYTLEFTDSCCCKIASCYKSFFGHDNSYFNFYFSPLALVYFWNIWTFHCVFPSLPMIVIRSLYCHTFVFCFMYLHFIYFIPSSSFAVILYNALSLLFKVSMSSTNLIQFMLPLLISSLPKY